MAAFLALSLVSLVISGVCCPYTKSLKLPVLPLHPHYVTNGAIIATGTNKDTEKSNILLLAFIFTMPKSYFLTLFVALAVRDFKRLALFLVIIPLANAESIDL